VLLDGYYWTVQTFSRQRVFAQYAEDIDTTLQFRYAGDY